MIDLEFRGRVITRGRPLVMAIINVTRDSFYDNGATFEFSAAQAAVTKALAEGADIIDIGGVRAGSAGETVDTAEEARRVVPLVTWTRQHHPDAVISVDTWRSEVAERVLDAGADLINDTWAGYDSRIVEVAGAAGAGYVCSHTGGLEPRTDPHRPMYADLIGEVIAETTALAERAVAAGVPRRGALIDPTFDFGKNTWHSLELLRHIEDLVATGWPVLIALSNKDFIGESLGLDDPADRVEGTLAATALAARAGAAVFRAHNIARTRSVLDTVAAITAPPAEG
ncbi:dihydropteroate synthase [Amycolatopsis thermoflava]|uniref:dihydropteroate synthase n=1 Tax=Amycolatopsis thermoflava TaxID=84480 RepID=UPI003D754BA9